MFFYFSMLGFVYYWMSVFFFSFLDLALTVYFRFKSLSLWYLLSLFYACITLSRSRHQMAIQILNPEFRDNMVPNLVNNQLSADVSTLHTEGHTIVLEPYMKVTQYVLRCLHAGHKRATWMIYVVVMRVQCVRTWLPRRHEHYDGIYPSANSCKFNLIQICVEIYPYFLKILLLISILKYFSIKISEWQLINQHIHFA